MKIEIEVRNVFTLSHDRGGLSADTVACNGAVIGYEKSSVQIVNNKNYSYLSLGNACSENDRVLPPFRIFFCTLVLSQHWMISD